MPPQTVSNLELTTQDKTFIATCAVLVTTYAGYALNSRRLLKKSLQESTEMHKVTSDKIAEAIDAANRKITDN